MRLVYWIEEHSNPLCDRLVAPQVSPFSFRFHTFSAFSTFSKCKNKNCVIKKVSCCWEYKIIFSYKKLQTWFTLATFRYSTPILTVRIDKSEIERPRVNKIRKKNFFKNNQSIKKEKNEEFGKSKIRREKCYS